jgi:phage terminase large subunit-like protein
LHNFVAGGAVHHNSGKTRVGAMLSVAAALGREDPSVQRWASANGLDVSSLPRKAGRVCASSLTGDLWRRVQRPALQRYLPAGTTWHALGTEARLPGGGVIVAKTNDQGPRAYQGDSWDVFWADEEHDEDVFNEGRMRLADRGGRAVLTMTPLLGRTWVWQRYVDSQEQASAVYHLDSRHNPHLPQGYLEALLKQYGEHERRSRQSGLFESAEGLVYPAWDRRIHVVPDRELPAEWTHYLAIDFGTRNPCAWLWFAVDGDDRLYVRRTVYGSGLTLSAQVDALQRLTGWREGSARPWLVAVADPEDAGSRLTLADEHGLPTVAAKKQIRAGVNVVSERLTPDRDGRPSLFILDHPSNRPIIREIESYSWAKGRGEPDKPAKTNDHTMDALRYGCMHVARFAPQELAIAIG